MNECDILGGRGLKHTLTLRHIFRGPRLPKFPRTTHLFIHRSVAVKSEVSRCIAAAEWRVVLPKDDPVCNGHDYAMTTEHRRNTSPLPYQTEIHEEQRGDVTSIYDISTDSRCWMTRKF